LPYFAHFLTMSLPSSDSPIVKFSSASLGGIGGWCVVHPFNSMAVRSSLATTSGELGCLPYRRQLHLISFAASTRTVWTSRACVTPNLSSADAAVILDCYNIVFVVR
jgi:hypothetical protein